MTWIQASDWLDPHWATDLATHLPVNCPAQRLKNDKCCRQGNIFFVLTQIDYRRRGLAKIIEG